MDPAGLAKIPKKAHFIWLGTPPPERVRLNVAAFRRLHPGWEIQIWRDQDLGWMRNREAYEAASTWPGRSDIARYEVILRHGGVYLDTDLRFLKSIDALTELAGALVVCPERAGLYNMAFFAAPPGHAFIEQLVDRVSDSVLLRPSAPPNETSGPIFFTRQLEIWLDGGGSAVSVPRDLIYPYFGDKLQRANGPWSPRTIAIHEWGSADGGYAAVGFRESTSPAGASPGAIQGLSSGLRRLMSGLRLKVRPRTRLLEFVHRADARVLGRGPQVVDVNLVSLPTKFGRRLIPTTPSWSGQRIGDVASKSAAIQALLARLLTGSDVYVDLGDSPGMLLDLAGNSLSEYGRAVLGPIGPEGLQATAAAVVRSQEAGSLKCEVILRHGESGDNREAVTRIGNGRLSRQRMESWPPESSTLDFGAVSQPPHRVVPTLLTDLSHIRVLRLDLVSAQVRALMELEPMISQGMVDFILVSDRRATEPEAALEFASAIRDWQFRGMARPRPLPGSAGRIKGVLRHPRIDRQCAVALYDFRGVAL